uniref:Cytochrome b n=1 Tax=Semnoderes armiger TaxID=1415233 RepID=A0A5H2QB46_9BILA|nr:cytochrome b [Semnoderes armiger]AYF57123.1 cytochrome b [Semnoderes armiger]
MKMMKKFNFLKNFKILKSVVLDLPAGMNLNFMWNFGSLLGLCLMSQLVSGLVLSLHYHNGVEEAFNSIIFIQRDINLGWLIRFFHVNGVSGFFIFIYLHLFRGLYFNCFNLGGVWSVGVVLLISLMGSAFFGYVLPYGQMSYWGATVITNLMSVLPYIGKNLVIWVWGGFAVGDATILRFFIFHFILPFVMLILIVAHLYYLHESGSNNYLGLDSNKNKIMFSFFIMKDFLGFLIYLWLLVVVCLKFPYIFGDSENFFKANSLLTPNHIKPEWYFLWAYAILRCVPSKVGGVVLLAMGVMIFFVLPMFKVSLMNMKFYFMGVMSFWVFVYNLILLTWIGGSPAEDPYYTFSQIFSVYYFFYFYLAIFFMVDMKILFY